ncbi:uncharacterized protein LOC143290140 [Babylonia areolata]|uniref:uncharacterized protein LOC143290140 n=1 Tax=Babylonia areolata TaxID=304850 RepID=UPI003FD57F77
MEMKQTVRVLTVLAVGCLLLAVVWCEEDQQGAQLEETEASQLKKRSVADPRDVSHLDEAGLDDMYDNDKRGSLFRFGKRGSLFRFGKRGSLFRFGKRGSLFRFGKRGSLFRFGKRDEDGVEDELVVYPDGYLPEPFRLVRESE